jgi:hypothetical protein
MLAHCREKAQRLGLDLGQVSDYSAVAVIEHAGRERNRLRQMRHLDRFPLGTKYN